MAAVPVDDVVCGGSDAGATEGGSDMVSTVSCSCCNAVAGAMNGFSGALNSISLPKLTAGNSTHHASLSNCLGLASHSFYSPLVALLVLLYFSTRLQNALTDSFQSLSCWLLSIGRVKKSEGWLRAFPLLLEEVGLADANS